MEVGGEVWVQLLGGQIPALVLFLFYEKVSGMRPRSRLSLPTFDDTGSLDSPLRQVVYPLVPCYTLDDCLPFPCEEWGG